MTKPGQLADPKTFMLPLRLTRLLHSNRIVCILNMASSHSIELSVDETFAYHIPFFHAFLLLDYDTSLDMNLA